MRQTILGIAVLFCSLPSLSSYADGRSSVYQVQVGVDLPTLAGSAIISLLPLHPSPSSSFSGDPASLNAMDRAVVGNHSQTAANLSDVTAPLAIIAPLVGDAWDVGFSAQLTEDVTVYTEALSINFALLNLVKNGVARPRPRLYAVDSRVRNSAANQSLRDNADNFRSFYSGHTATTVCALTIMAQTVSYRYGTSAWPWIAVGFIGSSVALERVAAGMHFYTDVLTGAAVGLGIGLIVPYLHRQLFAKTLLPPVSIGPALDGAQLLYTLQF